jgi:tripartite-type tricarboxylate transporter receptor subunit TctC
MQTVYGSAPGRAHTTSVPQGGSSMLKVLVALVALAGAPQAHAQEFPNRPITILVGLAPGGISDTMARVYAEAVSKTIGQKVVVENRAAASGAVAASALANAQPDGYTLLLFSGSQHSTIPALSVGASYDPIKGNQPVSLLFNMATVVGVPADSPVNDFADLVAFAKTKPDGLSFGSPGMGTPSHLMGAKLMHLTKTPVQFVHYRGGSPMMADFITGRLNAAVLSTPLAKPFLQDKKVKAVALDATERWAVIPQVPLLREVGYGDAAVATWFGVAASPGTPAEIVNKLNTAFRAAARDPDVIRRIEENGLAVATSTPQEMERLLVKEVADIADLVRLLGLAKP